MKERLRASEWAVVDVPLATARRLVTQQHYAAGGSNTGTFVHGLVRRTDPLAVQGVAWWIPPTRAAAETVHPDWRRVLSLTRLVVSPEVPQNGASFLLGRSVRLIEQTGRWAALVTYADTLYGHTGAIYKATNWDYLGLTPPEPVYVNAAGQMVARKAGGNTRTHADMLALGCERRVSPGKHKFVKVLKPRRMSAPQQMLDVA